MTYTCSFTRIFKYTCYGKCALNNPIPEMSAPFVRHGCKEIK